MEFLELYIFLLSIHVVNLWFMRRDVRRPVRTSWTRDPGKDLPDAEAFPDLLGSVLESDERVQPRHLDVTQHNLNTQHCAGVASTLWLFSHRCLPAMATQIFPDGLSNTGALTQSTRPVDSQ